jgi:anti-sigma regulatory factor (Ser/Thr protein kinase)
MVGLHPEGDVSLQSSQRGGALWHRIIDQGVKFGLVDPRLGSEVGRLAFYGQITEVEAEAASIVAEI